MGFAHCVPAFPAGPTQARGIAIAMIIERVIPFGTYGGSAGSQDMLESHGCLVVEIFLDNVPAILVQAAFNNT